MLSMQYCLIAMAKSSPSNQTTTIEATGSTLAWFVLGAWLGLVFLALLALHGALKYHLQKRRRIYKHIPRQEMASGLDWVTATSMV